LAPSNNGWYTPEKEDSYGGRDTAPETPAVGRRQVAIFLVASAKDEVQFESLTVACRVPLTQGK